MLKNQSQSKNGQSIVTVNGEDVCVATMSANVQESGVISFSKTIYSADTYKSNKESVDADVSEFEKSVLGGNVE